MISRLIETVSEVFTLISAKTPGNLLQTSEELIDTVKELLHNPYIDHNYEDFYNKFCNLEEARLLKE